MLETLAEPFGYPFILRGMGAAVLAGALCGGIGVFVVLKRMAYIGHGLAHAVLGGAVVSFVMSFNFLMVIDDWGVLPLRPADYTPPRKPQDKPYRTPASRVITRPFSPLESCCKPLQRA